MAKLYCLFRTSLQIKPGKSGAEEKISFMPVYYVFIMAFIVADCLFVPLISSSRNMDIFLPNRLELTRTLLQ